MRILVTGGLGFIGSSVAEKLLKDGHEVMSIDNLSDYYDPNLKIDNGRSLSKYPQFINKIFSVGEKEKLELEFKIFKPEIVFHAAGMAGVRPSLKDPNSYVQSNLDVLVTLLETMRICDVKKLVFCSSSSVYGSRDHQEGGFTEELPFDNAISFYATSKQCGELVTQMYHNLYGLSVMNLRFFTVYGPRQRPDLAIHKFLKATITGETIELFGDGSMKRDYTFIDDIVDGVCGSIDHVLKNNETIYETINLGNTNPMSILEMVDVIKNVADGELNCKFVPKPLGDVPITYANIDKAKKLIGFSPEVEFTDGIGRFYKWMKDKNLYGPAHVENHQATIH